MICCLSVITFTLIIFPGPLSHCIASLNTVYCFIEFIWHFKHITLAWSWCHWVYKCSLIYEFLKEWISDSLAEFSLMYIFPWLCWICLKNSFVFAIRPVNLVVISHHGQQGESKCSIYSRFAPSQWETSLQSKAVSHWLDANLEYGESPIALFMSSSMGSLRFHNYYNIIHCVFVCQIIFPLWCVDIFFSLGVSRSCPYSSCVLISCSDKIWSKCFVFIHLKCWYLWYT